MTIGAFVGLFVDELQGLALLLAGKVEQQSPNYFILPHAHQVPPNSAKATPPSATLCLRRYTGSKLKSAMSIIPNKAAIQVVDLSEINAITPEEFVAIVDVLVELPNVIFVDFSCSKFDLESDTVWNNFQRVLTKASVQFIKLTYHSHLWDKFNPAYRTKLLWEIPTLKRDYWEEAIVVYQKFVSSNLFCFHVRKPL